MPGRLRSALVVAALGLTQLAAVAWPAHACGCGALVAGDGTAITVHREVSAVQWDGERQDIVMRLDVAGDAAEAAWIMPVPGRAEVTLGDDALFGELSRAAAPEYRERSYFWPRDGDWPFADDSDAAGAMEGSAGSDDGVGLISRDRLGGFDVARLAATDPSALDDWLAGEGFLLPDDLARALEPYVAMGWEYVAVRLAPEEVEAAEGAQETGEADADGAVLGGNLDPLHLSFASDTLVYPMRLSRLAENPQSLRLYVLADHRMEPAGPIGGNAPDVAFAGRLPATEQPDAVAALAGGDRFLTVIDQEFEEPGRIDGDHELLPAAVDTEYREVIHRDRLLHWGPLPAWQVTVGGGVSLAAVAGVALITLRRRHAAREAPRDAATARP